MIFRSQAAMIRPSLAQLLFETGAEAAFAVETPTGRIVAANERARRLFGSGHELVDRKVAELFPGQLPALAVFTEAVLHKGRYWTRALTPQRADGGPLRLECLGTVVDGASAPTVLLSFSDLDARRQRDLDAEAEDHIRGGIAEWRRTERLF